MNRVAPLSLQADHQQPNPDPPVSSEQDPEAITRELAHQELVKVQFINIYW